MNEATTYTLCDEEVQSLNLDSGYSAYDIEEWLETNASVQKATNTPATVSIRLCRNDLGKEPCCAHAGEYNGFGSDGPLLFHCDVPNGCMCHD